MKMALSTSWVHSAKRDCGRIPTKLAKSSPLPHLLELVLLTSLLEGSLLTRALRTSLSPTSVLIWAKAEHSCPHATQLGTAIPPPTY
jgi:hypothetical protein